MLCRHEEFWGVHLIQRQKENPPHRIRAGDLSVSIISITAERDSQLHHKGICSMEMPCGSGCRLVREAGKEVYSVVAWPHWRSSMDLCVVVVLKFLGVAPLKEGHMVAWSREEGKARK